MIWGRPDTRVDERDTMFARMARQPGTRAYEDYYGRHPERRAVDDHLRSLPPLLEPGGRHFDHAICGEARAHFGAIGAFAPDTDLVASWAARLSSAPDLTLALETMARDLGAAAAGCCELDRAFVYTHKGRFDADYGRAIDTGHGCALVLLVEMRFDEMQHAPGAPVIRESALQYLRGARIAMTIAAALQEAGHDATPHYDAHYDVMLPPLAVAAGLGEIGRHNMLIADRFGTRVRIGAVTTRARLRTATRRSLGVERFCRSCLKCAENCPSRALSGGEPEPVNGVRKWPTHVERCYGYWRTVGTDCGICMAVCPFSHRDTRFHNLMRRLVRLLPWMAKLFVWGDDLVYGRVWRRQ